MKQNRGRREDLNRKLSGVSRKHRTFLLSGLKLELVPLGRDETRPIETKTDGKERRCRRDRGDYPRRRINPCIGGCYVRGIRVRNEDAAIGLVRHDAERHAGELYALRDRPCALINEHKKLIIGRKHRNGSGIGTAVECNDLQTARNEVRRHHGAQRRNAGEREWRLFACVRIRCPKLMKHRRRSVTNGDNKAIRLTAKGSHRDRPRRGAEVGRGVNGRV